MSLQLIRKQFYHRSSRHRLEAYNPVLAHNGTTLAYLLVEGETERLVLQPGAGKPSRALTEPGILLDPCFAGEEIYWVQREGDLWSIRSTVWTANGENRTLAVPVPGRPRGLAYAPAATGGWLAWEERTGRQTGVRLLRLDGRGGTAPNPIQVSPAGSNAYDPRVTVAVDGSVYCIYAAYAEDNYRIYLARFSPDGEPLGPPCRLSDRCEPCVFPSLWPAARGGVWFSFTSFCVPVVDRPELMSSQAFVKHERYVAARRYFRERGLAHAGLFDGTRILAPWAGPNRIEHQSFTAACMVFGTEGALHTQVLEDRGGGVHLIARQHLAAETPPVFAKADKPLAVHPKFVNKAATQLHPALTVSSLVDAVWQKPVMVVPRAHFDQPVSLAVADDTVHLAFGEDARLTGWSGGGEWTDDRGETGLGVATVELTAKNQSLDLRPFTVSPVAAGRLTAPVGKTPEQPDENGLVPALGQTHCHSSLSICRRELDRDPHLNYRFMQDVQHCRFGTLTDHEYNLWHTEMLLMRKFADYYYFPGEFVAYHAYEWTGSDPRDCGHDGGPFGHVNVLGFDRLGNADIHNPSDPASAGNTLPRLWTCLHGRDCVTPPHHVVDSAHFYNWSFWNAGMEPFIEIFQDERGSGEQPDAPGVTNFLRNPKAGWAVDALRLGRRFGFVASGDHTGVALAGVWTEAFTRQALLQAFRRRLCFGTTGLHAAVRFSCNERRMGEENAGPPAHFRLQVDTAEPVLRVEVLRNGHSWRDLPRKNGHHQWTWTADDAKAGDFWYCRILWTNGELAWTSPIWI